MNWNKKSKEGSSSNEQIEALKENEESYRSFFEHIEVGAAIFEPTNGSQDYAPKLYNKSAEPFLGINGKKVNGENSPESLPYRPEADFLSLLRRVGQTGIPEKFSKTCSAESKSNPWIDIRGSRLPDGELAAIYEDVSHSSSIEKLLRESETRWRFVLEGSGDGVWDWNVPDNDVYFSSQWKSMLGYEDHEIGNQLYEWENRVHPEDKVECYKDLNRHLNGETPFYENEHRVLCKDGTYKWILDRGKVLEWSEDGRPARVLGTHTDITERKRAEAALKERDVNYTGFFNAIDDMIVIASKSGEILYTNPAVSLKLGYSSDELHKMHVLDLHPPGKRSEAQEIFAEMFKGQRDSCPLPVQRKDGTLVPVETRVWFGKWNGSECVFGMSKDLSKEQEALQKFDRFFNLNPSPMAVSSIPERKIVDVNQAFLSALGYSREDVLGKTSSELGIFVDLGKQDEIARRFQSCGTIRNIELQVKTKKREILDGLFSGEAIESQGRKYFLTSMLDITERKRFERALIKSEEKFRTFVDYAYDWEYWCAPDKSIRYMSPSCERITGYPASTFMDDPGFLASIVYAEDIEKWYQHELECIDEKEPQQIDFRIVHRSGDIRWISHSCQAVFGNDGKWIGRRASNRDITDRKLVEESNVRLVEELRKAMAEIKTLSGFIPICASCKKIRDDNGYWEAVEVYIRDRTDAQFSHSICPDCLKTLYPKFYGDK